jgi:superfamily II DNA or RNA helicase
MSTILSKRGYKVIKKKFSPTKLNKVRKDLSVKPFTAFKMGPYDTTKPFNVYYENHKKLYLPKHYAIKEFGPPEVVDFDDGCDIDLPFNGSMRSEQSLVVKKYMDCLPEKGGGLISLPCGAGKTVIALNIISLIKKKTIILVHKDFLMNQWYDRIKQFLPKARIGKIQQNTTDVEDKDIVLAMVQSISMKDYDMTIFDEFGLAVFDECHHLGAEVFSKSLLKVNSKYMLGLSATPKRKDGLSKVFEWFIGDMVYCKKERDEDNVLVEIHKYYDESPDYSEEIYTVTKNLCMPRMINNICAFPPRHNMIYDLLKENVAEGRDILILSDRREHLKTIYGHVTECGMGTIGYYVGGMKPADLRETTTKQIILGTFSMAAEGMDIPKLNTIILASPKSDIIQSVGRILRQKPEDRKHLPKIIDICDDFSAFSKQALKRQAYYKKCKYSIQIINTDGDIENVEYKKKGKGKGKTKAPIVIDFSKTDEYLIDDY